MKKTLTMLFFICPFWAISQHGSIQIPTHIKTVFSEIYPDISGEKWEKDEDGYYKVTFFDDSVQTMLFINSQGNVYQKRITVSNAELPKIIQEEVAELFPGKKMLHAFYYIKSDGRTTYSVWMEEEIEKYFFTWDY